MEANEVKFGKRYTLKRSPFLGRPKEITVTAVERTQRLDFFRVRDESGQLLTESIHSSDLTPA